jgi:hypothetical protein
MILGLTVLGLLLTVGCGSNYGHVPKANVIMVNAGGRPVDPTGNINCNSNTNNGCNGKHSALIAYNEVTPEKYEKHIEAVIDGLSQYSEKRKDAPRKILIFIHGGLNLQTYSVERAAELVQTISDEEKSYPIFINWQSAWLPSYWKHLVHVRQGEDWGEGAWSTLGGYLTAPVYLATDLARAAMRAPAVTFLQIRNDIETVPIFRPALSLWSSDLALAEEAAFDALCKRAQSPRSSKAAEDTVHEAIDQYRLVLDRQSKDCKYDENDKHELAKLNIWSGADRRGILEKLEAFTKYFATLPFKLATAPLIDGLGTSSWYLMLRSASQLFHYDGEQGTHIDVNPDLRKVQQDTSGNVGENLKHFEDYRTTGALALFLKDLTIKICGESYMQSCENKDNWEITLVGHSMGAIILNNIIREFEHLPIRNIVYLAGATTMRDYQDTVFPYLKKRNSSVKPADIRCNPVERREKVEGRDKDVCIYHLMLHEAAESGEWISDIIDPFPRGSLLIWLDNFLSHPLTKDDRTLGRFTNFIAAVHHTPPELKPYIHIVKFGAGREVRSPQRHGDFGQKLKFWKPACWILTENDYSRACFDSGGHF